MFCCCAASENNATNAVVLLAEAHPGLIDEQLDSSAVENAEEPETATAPEQVAPTALVREAAQQPPAPPTQENPPAARSVREKAVVIVFRTGEGSKVEHAFTKRPVGLEWQKRAPLTLDRVVPGTAASEKGLQPGWAVMTVNGEDIAQSDYEDASAKIKSAVLKLPASSVTLTFQKPDGSSAELAFTRRPIGMGWKNGMPLTVANVVPGTQSAERGLQPGWSLLALDGESVSTGDYADVSAKLKAAALTLPKQ